MKSRNLLFLFLLARASTASGQYKTALPGYRFEFPRDHFNHEEFQTEWWYTTGNVDSGDGHKYGFELTFFRQGVDRGPDKTASWDLRDLYLAHLALSDLDGGKFYYTERLNRGGPGIAGADKTRKKIWNGNWELRWNSDDQLQLIATDGQFSLELTLVPQKPPVIQGENGVSRKSASVGQASHYISFTRLKTTGTITRNEKNVQVNGTSWMDHEFFTRQLGDDQVGWDWLGVQLDDNSELMLYQFRRKDGSVDSFSSGTFVDGQGRSVHLPSADFHLFPSGGTWTSSVTSARYPIAWTMEVPKLGLKLQASTRLKSQELAGNRRLAPNYWEGAITVQGTRNGATVRGVGYLEMTGYDRAVELGPQ